ncbi:hypothetical protein [Streptomyces purpureus]|uniref:Uncharacterized protein n=1 Tax=Streptomyces purpureus TaxID=1951 RepID=A0A918GZZ1_9ACTN|nr:hypothetical protein [Streptomyces purpureus]GGT20599.1 hypothetical protein GCM10014713_11820 [Streptomyces purpureus]
MVLLGQQTALVRHSGPPRKALFTWIAVAAALCTAVGAAIAWRYNDRPPWGSEIAYEAGYIHATRIRQADVKGDRVPELLGGGCVQMEFYGVGGQKATHDPGAWVAGCLDGAAGRPSSHQGLAY